MIAIISSCGSNYASIQFALERLGRKSLLTVDPQIINSASHVILPGVGTASYAMARLTKFNLPSVIRSLQQPVLGICLGMQILYATSCEGNVNGLGILPDNVIKIPHQPGITLPHMGWNKLRIMKEDSPLLHNIPKDSYVYFIHSYMVPLSKNTIAITKHGTSFSAVVQHNNFQGVQFHPERSGKVGEQILRNFCELEC